MHFSAQNLDFLHFQLKVKILCQFFFGGVSGGEPEIGLKAARKADRPLGRPRGRLPKALLPFPPLESDDFGLENRPPWPPWPLTIGFWHFLTQNVNIIIGCLMMAAHLTPCLPTCRPQQLSGALSSSQPAQSAQPEHIHRNFGISFRLSTAAKRYQGVGGKGGSL